MNSFARWNTCCIVGICHVPLTNSPQSHFQYGPTTRQNNVNSLNPLRHLYDDKGPVKHEVNIKVVFIKGNTIARDTSLVYVSVWFTVSQRSAGVLLKGSTYREFEVIIVWDSKKNLVLEFSENVSQWALSRWALAWGNERTFQHGITWSHNSDEPQHAAWRQSWGTCGKTAIRFTCFQLEI